MLRLFFLCSFLASTVGAAVPRYFAVFFATGEGHRTLHTHTFVTFIREDEGMQIHTISWLPANYAAERVILPGAQEGKNYSLAETFALAAVANAPVYVWGPYAIDEKTFAKGVAQARHLHRGLSSYSLIDGFSRYHSSINCGHAVSDAFSGGTIYTGILRGQMATGLILHHLARRKILNPKHAELSVLHRLLPIARRGQKRPAVFVRQAGQQRWLPYDAMQKKGERR